MDFLRIAARIAADKLSHDVYQYVFRVHTGPTQVKSMAEAFREAGLDVQTEGTESIYVQTEGQDYISAAKSALDKLKSNGNTFGLGIRDFRHDFGQRKLVKIDASSNPDRALVARDLKKILAAVGPAYSGYSESQIVNEIIRSVNHLKGSDDLLSTANDFIIRLDDQTNTISAILNEADPSGNVSEIKIEFELVRKGPVIKTLV
jgi:hypothetical protein